MMGGYGQGYGYGYDMMGGWFGWILMMGFWLLVLVGLIVLVVWAVRSASGHGTPHGQAPSSSAAAHDEAVAIAKRRLASGEITPDQYAEIIRALGG